MKQERIIEILEGYNAAKILELKKMYDQLLKDESISYEQLMQALEYDNEVLKNKKCKETSLHFDPVNSTYIRREQEDIEYMTNEIESINVVLDEYGDYDLHKKALELAYEENKEIQNKKVNTEIRKILKNTTLD